MTLSIIRLNTLGPILCMLVLGFFTQVLGEDSSYARLAKGHNGQPLRFETSIVHLTSPTYTVDLISAVHVGDKSYFTELNQRFKKYDGLLYELIAPKDHDMSQRSNANPLSLLQLGLKNALKLEFQLDAINYSAPNFIHADLSPEEFSDAMKNRGESFQGIFFQLVMESYMKMLSDPNKAEVTNLKLLMAIMDPNSSLELKRVIAEELADLETSMMVLNDSSIIAARNERAIQVLAREIKQGKKKLAIYYGAAHMAEMERAIINTFPLRRDSTEWITAWNLEEQEKKG